MALEDLLKEMIATTKESIEVTKSLIALRTEAIENVKGAAASTPKATATKAAAAAATTEAAAEPKADPAPVTGGVDPKVYEELSGLVAAFIAGTTREEERTARKEWVKKLLQHDSIKKPGTPDNVFDTANIKDDAIQAFRDNMAAKTQKGDITTAPASTSLVD